MSHNSFEAAIDTLSETIPDFTPLRCRNLRRLEAGLSADGQYCRVVLDYDGRLEIALRAEGVSELPRLPPATNVGVLPYAPYELGEFLMSDQPQFDRIVLFDELNGWRIVAKSIVIEGIREHVAEE